MFNRKSQFGPWSTAIDSGGIIELSAFWKARMSQLGPVSRGRGGIGPFSFVALLLGALVVVAVPTFQVGIVLAQPGPKPAPRMQHREPELASPAEARLERKLNEPISVDFVDLPLKDALNYLDVIQNLKWKLQYDSTDDAKIPVTISLHQVPLRVLLKLLLEPVQLAWIIREDQIVITTYSEAQAHSNVWNYDVSDLVAMEIPADELAAAITSTIAHRSWEPSDEPASLKVENRILVVRQSRAVHEQIKRILGDARRELAATRADRLARLNEVRTVSYSVEGFVDPELPEKALIDSIQSHVYKSTWNEFGGRGMIRIKDSTQLEITQYWWVHDYLSNLFDQVRNLGLEDGRNGSFKFDMGLMWATSEEVDPVSLVAALSQPVSVEFKDVKLTDVLSQIYVNFGVFCSVPDETRRQVADANPFALTLKGVSLRSVLQLTLEPFGLEGYVGDYRSVKIVSQDTAAARRDIQVIRIKEQVVAGRTAADLIQQITKSIEPKSWSSAGGSATIRALPGLLVVSHNRKVGARIENFLDDLKP